MKKFAGKRVCVACSGGADSLCLLHYLSLRAAQDGFVLSAVHIEHGLRGEKSKEDAAFVADFCKQKDIPLFSFSFDCRALAAKEKIGVEEAARKARYGAFETLLSDNKADVIATAHHANDEAETVLFNLLRGSSLTGAGGIKEARRGYIRPFLRVTKAEILAYAAENRLSFREDETNFIAETTRNKLRLEIFPELEKIVPGAAKNLSAFASSARRDDEFLYSLASSYMCEEKSSGRVIVLARAENGEETPDPLFTRACVLAMKRLGVTKDYTRLHLNALLNLRRSQTGSIAHLPCGIRARRVYGEIEFFVETQPQSATNALKSVEIDFAYGTHEIGGAKILITQSETEAIAAAEKACAHTDEKTGANQRAKILLADGARLKNTVIRFKKEGDTFRKFGGGEKSLKKYLVDCKIPAAMREKIPLIAEKGSKEILVVIGTEISEKVKITPETREIACVVLLSR